MYPYCSGIAPILCEEMQNFKTTRSLGRSAHLVPGFSAMRARLQQKLMIAR